MLKLHQDIIELEKENMTSILKDIGMSFDSSKLKVALLNGQNVVTIYKKKSLIGVIRYIFENNKTIKVLSIQIKNPSMNKGVLYPLLKKAIKTINNQNIDNIITIVQKSNILSIAFHNKLGFRIDNEFDKAILFKIPLAKLEEKFKL